MVHFYSVFTEEDCSDLSSLRKSNKLSSIIQSINFTTQNVFQELSQLNPNKAYGPDLLTPLLLKKSAEFICESSPYASFLPRVCLWVHSLKTGLQQMLSLCIRKGIAVLQQIIDPLV